MNRFAWRQQYDVEQDTREGNAAITEVTGESRTVQHFAKEADINEIMRRFGVTDGAIPPAVTDPRYFGDFSDVPDFRQALDNVRNAEAAFAALPADLRRRFGNDPVELFQFVHDPKNLEESIKLGLLKREEPAAPAPDAPAA